MSTNVTFRQIGEALLPVQDPEIHMSIVELGLVYGPIPRKVAAS